VGALLYWAKQWGGGDAKLLAGVGALLGFDVAWLLHVSHGMLFPAPSFIIFLVFLLLCGAVYGAAWLAILAWVRRETFIPAFRSRLRERKTARLVVLAMTALLVGGSLVATVTGSWSVGLATLLLATLLFGGFYLILAVQAAECSLLVVKKRPRDLVEGDWVLGPLRTRALTIPTGSSATVNGAEIRALDIARVREVCVRQGVPFVPSFFFAFVILAVMRWWVFA
jgi:hypothetical protein